MSDLSKTQSHRLCSTRVVKAKTQPARKRKSSLLESLPSIGQAAARYLRRVRINNPSDLAGQDPYRIFQELCDIDGKSYDPCLCDQFIAATRFVNGEPARAWWTYSAERKRAFARLTTTLLLLAALLAPSVFDGQPASRSKPLNQARHQVKYNMKFGYSILYVHDVEQTLAFYEKAFGFKRRMLAEKKEYGELETGGTRLAFAEFSFAKSLTPVQHAEVGLHRPVPPIELGMVTEDVENALHQALAAGATQVKSPEKKPWGQTVAYVRDPNGFLVEICSPLD